MPIIESVSVMDSVLVAAFTLAMVFVVLAALYTIVRLFSVSFAFFGANRATDNAAAVQTPAPLPVVSDEPRLIQVDEPTAAIIMAVISHESGIPLSELKFRSIKAL